MVDVSLINFSVGHINVSMRGLVGGDDWLFTGFYGNPRVELTRESWRLLEMVRRGEVNCGFVWGI